MEEQNSVVPRVSLLPVPWSERGMGRRDSGNEVENRIAWEGEMGGAKLLKCTTFLPIKVNNSVNTIKVLDLRNILAGICVSLPPQ